MRLASSSAFLLGAMAATVPSAESRWWRGNTWTHAILRGHVDSATAAIDRLRSPIERRRRGAMRPV